MGTAWFKSGSYEFDSNGDPADGALAYFYQAGTSTPLTVYSDGAESTPHEDPVEADGNGRWPLVFVPFVATYKFVLKTAAGTTLFTADNVPNPAPFTDAFEVDADAQLTTGEIFMRLTNGTRSGAVRLNGRTIGDASSGGTERANADCADLFAHIWNTCANGQAAVSGGRGATPAADFAAHKTIALPDWRSGSPVGFPDMGSTDNTLLDAAPVILGSTTAPGSILGANTHTLSTAEAPAHTHSFSATTGAGGSHTHSISLTTSGGGAHDHGGATGTDTPDHSHNVTVGTNTANSPGGATYFAAGSGTTFASAGASTTHTHSIATGGSHDHTVSGTSGAEAAHTHSVSGTSGSTGGGGAHNNLSRSGLVTFYIKL